jgi:hypothetical protein
VWRPQVVHEPSPTLPLRQAKSGRIIKPTKQSR